MSTPIIITPQPGTPGAPGPNPNPPPQNPPRPPPKDQEK